MSLYRQPGRIAARTLAFAALAALVIGLVAGFALGRGTAGSPSLAEELAALREQLRPATGGLELTATEYGQAVRGGRIVAPTEYQAAQADVARVRETLAGARADLRALDAPRAAALDAAVGRLAAAVRERAEPAEVRRLAGAAGRALTALAGS